MMTAFLAVAAWCILPLPFSNFLVDTNFISEQAGAVLSFIKSHSRGQHRRDARPGKIRYSVHFRGDDSGDGAPGAGVDSNVEISAGIFKQSRPVSGASLSFYFRKRFRYRI